jgi:methyl-accepting chemotaxis protein
VRSQSGRAAARAGAHGRGFAVVAAEVRKLSERSRMAAQESLQLASSCVKIAERSGQLLHNYVPAIYQTAELVQQMAATSKLQATGVDQIAKAMALVDRVTQQNAASIEQLSATAVEMAERAEALRAVVAFFRIGGEAAELHGVRPPLLAPSRTIEPSRDSR